MPRLVHIVFSASGVTMIKQEPVPGLTGRGGSRTGPRWPGCRGQKVTKGVVAHLSDEADDRPETPGRQRYWPPNRPKPRLSDRERRRSSPTASSTSVIVPFSRPKPATSESCEGASTSTMAWPRVTTSGLEVHGIRVVHRVGWLPGIDGRRLRVTEMADYRLGGSPPPALRPRVNARPGRSAASTATRSYPRPGRTHPSLVLNAADCDLRARLETPGVASRRAGELDEAEQRATIILTSCSGPPPGTG